jgi:uroporphyrinogen-III synthase
MSAPVLVLRPEPAAGRTAVRLAERGLTAIRYPLFVLQALAWTPPAAEDFDAILLTSANALRLGGPELAHFHGLPAYAVGLATAKAATDAGFKRVTTGGGDAASTVPMIVADGRARVLHVCGEDVRPYDRLDLTVTQVRVYRSVEAGDTEGLAAVLPFDGPVAAVIHSPRAGLRLSALVAGSDRARIAVVAISSAALDACGTGWRTTAIAASPDETHMLACVEMLV